MHSLESICGITNLSSSFLPECSRLRTARPAWTCVFSVRTLKWHGNVVAATRKKIKKKKKEQGTSGSTVNRDWSYEHLMVVWDEVFEQCCSHPDKASTIQVTAHNGWRKYGRGCVHVYQEIQSRPRGSGTGFTSKPPRSSLEVPDFVTLNWHVCYLPRDFLVDPSKAPIDEPDNEGNREHDSNGKTVNGSSNPYATYVDQNMHRGQSIDNLDDDYDHQIHTQDNVESPFIIFDDDKVSDEDWNDSPFITFDNEPQKDTSSASANDKLNVLHPSYRHKQHAAEIVATARFHEDVMTAQENSTSIVDICTEANKDCDENNYVQLISQQMLLTSIRGMDVTRLRSLTTNFDFEAANFRMGSKTAVIDTRTMDAGGEDPYNPIQDELVLLLHLVIDRRPAFGADVVIAYKDIKSNSWKLRLKYEI